MTVTDCDGYIEPECNGCTELGGSKVGCYNLNKAPEKRTSIVPTNLLVSCPFCGEELKDHGSQTWSITHKEECFMREDMAITKQYIRSKTAFERWSKRAS